ncbi:MAG: bifunctional folylpolyglutamate synthase/dihydrofolate synthase [Ruminococcus sp.]|nr:bifunctional folylpolyglutamate synthase/dihydrofolate synthase [Ruminococcus sp.]
MAGTALDYLKTAASRGSKLGLERTAELMERLGSPQESLPVIHIAGTNGKGSFGAMLSSVLTCAGYKTGSFSSPALTGVTDSFRINGQEISPRLLGEVLEQTILHAEAMADKPTEFEVLTAAAYQLFRQEGCDLAVVECGMGGDGDSTNVVSSPLLSVITNVQLDHAGFLGDTVAEIAGHKAGIIKAGRPVLFGGDDPDALRIVRERAESLGSPLTVTDLGRLKVGSMSAAGTDLSFAGMGSFHIGLLGTYQPLNTANVLTAVELLRSEGLTITDQALKDGLAGAKWHGRFEVLRRDPLVIFDGSHNPDGIRCAADSIRLYFGEKPVVLLIGVMADKDYGLYGEMLRELAKCAFTVEPDNPRALDSEALAESLAEKGIPSKAYKDLGEGVREAFACAKENSLPLIALGSLYMYKELTQELPE